ncbi:cell division protein SepF [Weissella coleopterorum]|nr:cell division protein SepF [Weissella coleopterorum]
METFKKFFNSDEEDYEYSSSSQGYYDEPVATADESAANTAATNPVNNTDSRPKSKQQQRPNVLAMDAQLGDLAKIVVFEPRIYSDVKEIVNEILNGNAALINFSSIDNAQSMRIVDYLAGAAQSVEGSVQRIGESIFLATPHNFEISGTISQNLGNSFEN